MSCGYFLVCRLSQFLRWSPPLTFGMEDHVCGHVEAFLLVCAIPTETEILHVGAGSVSSDESVLRAWQARLTFVGRGLRSLRDSSVLAHVLVCVCEASIASEAHLCRARLAQLAPLTCDGTCIECRLCAASTASEAHISWARLAQFAPFLWSDFVSCGLTGSQSFVLAHTSLILVPLNTSLLTR